MSRLTSSLSSCVRTSMFTQQPNVRQRSLTVGCVVISLNVVLLAGCRNSASSNDELIRRNLEGNWIHHRTELGGGTGHFSFSKDGTLIHDVSSSNPLLNVGYGLVGRIYYRWSVNNGILTLIFESADNPVGLALRGQTTRFSVLKHSADSIELGPCHERIGSILGSGNSSGAVLIRI